ncbi:MAG: GrpB family protein [Eubacteriales bacterium]|nr:GrpB family protein [Eubacteriales bacterium]
MLGLKRNEVVLIDHQSEWEEKAAETINKLKEIFGDTAIDIQHIGSTAIHNIKAKPMLDIVLGVESFDMLDDILPKLAENGVYKSSTQPLPGIILCAIKANRESDIVLCNLHIVVTSSEQWNNHIVFRDYMNAFPQKAAAYEKLKIELAEKFSADRKAYCNGKNEFINTCISEARIYTEMKLKLDITAFEPITEGLSGDKKYYIEESGNGENRFLLRISDILKYKRKETIFKIMKKAADLGIPMCKPVDFGICNDGKSVYQLLTWCEGGNLEKVLTTFSESEQYKIGIKAGKILRKIHSIPAPLNLDDWYIRYFNQNDDRIKAYSGCGIRIDDSEKILQFIEDNKYLLHSRPQCFNHGDFHTGNLMVTNKGDVSVIDWEILDFDNYADPWNEFNRIGLSEIRPYFTTGLINRYFNGEPPIEFWRLLAFYLAAGSLMLLSWAYYSQQDELDFATRQVKNILAWYDNMQNIIPSWYIKNY